MLLGSPSAWWLCGAKGPSPCKAMLAVEYGAGSLSLRVVDADKHLGGIVASSGSQCRELQARVKATNSGVAALNRPVLSQHEVPLDDKLQLCATLADTRLFLYAGALLSSRRCTVRVCTFSDVPPTCYRSVENENATDREVLVAAGCYTIDVQVAMLRLLFFARLVQWGTAPLFAVLQAGDGMPRRGIRHCVGISLGSTERRDAANSRTRMMATAVTGLHSPSISLLSGRRE